MEVAVNPEREERDIFIFPLNTVLFPDGTLALKIFEQRYIEMTKACLRDSAPFGVCLIREGTEVGEPAVPHGVGCLASIAQWDMPQLGLFHLTTSGVARIALRETRVAPNGLISARVELIPEEGSAEMDAACREVLKVIVDRTGAANFPSPLKLDDPGWVSYRLSETLPLPLPVRQQLLESDTATRFRRLREMLVQQGVLTD